MKRGRKKTEKEANEKKNKLKRETRNKDVYGVEYENTRGFGMKTERYVTRRVVVVMLLFSLRNRWCRSRAAVRSCAANWRTRRPSSGWTSASNNTTKTSSRSCSTRRTVSYVFILFFAVWARNILERIRCCCLMSFAVIMQRCRLCPPPSSPSADISHCNWDVWVLFYVVGRFSIYVETVDLKTLKKSSFSFFMRIIKVESKKNIN